MDIREFCKGWKNGEVTPGNGLERWSEFYSPILKRWMVQYDYRAPDGELFSCVAKNLGEAREKRYAWIENRNK